MEGIEKLGFAVLLFCSRSRLTSTVVQQVSIRFSLWGFPFGDLGKMTGLRVTRSIPKKALLCQAQILLVFEAAIHEGFLSGGQAKKFPGTTNDPALTF